MKVLYVDLDIVQHSDSLILILSRCHWYLPCSLAVIGICPTLSLSLVFALLSRCHWYLPSSFAVIDICPPLSLSLVFALLISSVLSSWCSTAKLFFHHDWFDRAELIKITHPVIGILSLYYYLLFVFVGFCIFSHVQFHSQLLALLYFPYLSLPNPS